MGRKVQDFYPGPYGLGYYHTALTWEAVRNHPLFVDEVLKHVRQVEEQIERLRSFGPGPVEAAGGIRKALAGVMLDLGRLSDVGVEIAKDVGWGDPKDIMIAIQRHPLVAEALDEREALVKKLEEMRVI